MLDLYSHYKNSWKNSVISHKYIKCLRTKATTNFARDSFLDGIQSYNFLLNIQKYKEIIYLYFLISYLSFKTFIIYFNSLYNKINELLKIVL